MSELETITPQATTSDAMALTYRLTGAIIWLGIMVVVVPSWYNNPVQFDPDKAMKPTETSVLVEAPLLLPEVATARLPAEQRAAQEPSASMQVEPAKPEEAASISPKSDVKSSDSITQESTAEKTWIIRLVAYRQKEMAEALQQRLKYDYAAYIKYFPKSHYYSVRIGPYSSKERAVKDQKRLDQLLRVKSELVKVEKAS